MEYGYIRVSTLDQNEDRQRRAMAARGIPRERMFIDKQSGKDFHRVCCGGCGPAICSMC